MSNLPPVPVAPRRSRLAGPVVLIVMGILSLMGTIGVLHWHKLGGLFAHYWPVLIILWGIIKLIAYEQAQRQGRPASGGGAGGVFLLLFLIVAGLIATQASRVNWRGLHDEIGWGEDNFGDLFGNTYSYSDKIVQSFPTGGSVHVVSRHGAVRVLASDENRIEVEIAKKVHADNQQNADKYNKASKPQITVIAKVVTVNAKTQGADDDGILTDMSIRIPRQATIVISSRHGDVSVTGRDGNVEVSNQRGDIVIEDIIGNTSLNLQHGSAKVSNVSGDVSVEGRLNHITVSDVKGEARMSGEFMESVKLSRIDRTVSFKSARTDMEFSKLEGTLDLESGDLRANSIVGPGRLITKSKNISLEGLSGDLRLENSNGPVRIQIRKMGDIQVENRNADIQISLPPQAAFRLDASARNGEIQSDFGELKIQKVHNVATAGGSVGNGSASVRLNNEHGKIEIHRGAIPAMAPPVPLMPVTQ